MIDKIYGKFYAICDGCGEELDPTDTFDEAKSQADAEGWETKRWEQTGLICARLVQRRCKKCCL
jgi:hypothetical protein